MFEGEQITNEIGRITPSIYIPNIIKDAIKEAILDGDIENNYDAAYNYMLAKGKELGLIAETN